ncbi:TonB family protein [Mucilaginibacter sp. RB4R14]|uniref:energy transducer TonB n=1 Tax=Mucilaginibacter aurantiaciroseus TaxID=2949308 RepID=UPI00209044CB|nr:energy transducer TonB [Mucilaginibacter aurantiaciroseus]MCO5934788.1 TonB family protein [Mucilaginibacter aurantiaciroseus]
MLKNILTVILLALISCPIIAQDIKEQAKPGSDFYYMVSDNQLAKDSKDAKFIRLYTRADSGMLKVEEFYMNNKPKLIGKTFALDIDFRPGLQGYCIEYYMNGKRKSINNYNKGQLVGEGITYYPSGTMYNITEKNKNGMYLKSCLDSTGKILAENGNGIWFKTKNDSVKIFLVGPVINGKEDGVWEKHISDTTYTIVYKKGEITSGKEFINNKDPFAHIIADPQFPGGEEKFFKFLASTIKYPSIDREQKNSGKVILAFAIDKDGSVKDAKIIRGVSATIDAEVMRAIKRSPKWKPGTKDGRFDKALVSIPVSFDTSTGSSIILGNQQNLN